MSRKNRIQFGAPSRVRKSPSLPQAPLTLNIERLSHEGRGIARVDGKTIFVAGGLPGETLTARITAQHKRYNEAELVEIQTASPDRSPAFCPHFQQCGGCDLQHLNIDQQRAHKQQQVLDQLARFASVIPEQIEEPILGPDRGYRRAARIGINQRQRDGELLVGFRRRGSNKLLNIDTCPVLDVRLQPVFATLREHLKDLNDIRSLTHVDVSCGDDDGFIRFRCTRRPNETLMSRLKAVSQQLQLKLVIGLNDGDMPIDEGLAHYTLPEADIELGFSSTDFIQVNAGVNKAMINQAIAWLAPQPDQRVLDLFCGLGNFTLPLARKAAQIVGVEGSAEMVGRARQNAANAGIQNAEFYRADLSESFRHATWFREGFDLILLDPPRTGAREAVQQLSHYGAAKVLYISCNPSALVADLPLLTAAGYRVTRFGIMDMFPHTAHVESMLLLERTDA
ncbi:23S rRNA (uracil(1939)-C(5))-methyltransferase RlmD [Marinobacterium sediminicola]|uniref:23S rRNA (uracil(1939)-C(5))-methyltransferase RlmD n=1 Tax=Marinobacterium sediminicola TaxID=518898 RepID=A0ABY1RX33_9GAMM|nr:23S rRNA (uracil(1939)-C(5))-methyltransferase RlmD [Marinobacterium sediminicola]ULG67882.1 23S rRNA (uracil(1939)-C(5))-methyltransferase RlmD [Marinobacterium sediminicola]SMR71414.1 23S rRNA m(5)U-1939 methyltransferase [Marinobacterium sediminicola]